MPAGCPFQWSMLSIVASSAWSPDVLYLHEARLRRGVISGSGLPAFSAHHLPFLAFVHAAREGVDITPRILERDELATIGQRDRFVELA
jgi:hypothetical protein